MVIGNATAADFARMDEAFWQKLVSINQIATQNLSTTVQTANAAQELNQIGIKLNDLLKESGPTGD